MHLEYLTPNDWNLLRSRSGSKSFRKDEIIIAYNSRPNALFILKKGSAAVEVIRGKIIARLGSGDICGEMAFIEKSVASASVIAETDVEVETFEVPQVSEIFASYPHVEARFYKSLAVMLSKRLRRTSSELGKLIDKNGGSK